MLNNLELVNVDFYQTTEVVMGPQKTALQKKLVTNSFLANFGWHLKSLTLQHQHD